MKTPRDFIAKIEIDKANLEFIAKRGLISGSLLVSIEQAIEDYNKQFQDMRKEKFDELLNTMKGTAVTFSNQPEFILINMIGRRVLVSDNGRWKGRVVDKANIPLASGTNGYCPMDHYIIIREKDKTFHVVNPICLVKTLKERSIKKNEPVRPERVETGKRRLAEEMVCENCGFPADQHSGATGRCPIVDKNDSSQTLGYLETKYKKK
jgi:hypothetical protein